MFDGLKRNFVFGKLADALDSLRRRLNGEPSTGDGKVLGWSMGNWKLWAEGALLSGGLAGVGVGVAKAQAYLDCLSAGTVACSVDWHSIGLAVASAVVGGIVGWIRRSPVGR